MWLVLTILSAILLGVYDVAKKKALERNGVLWVLLAATVLTTLFLAPFLRAGTPEDHLQLAIKALIVTVSWVSGMMGLKLLPVTTVSTIKGSRPVFVVILSILLYGERLNGWQGAGIVLVLLSLFLLTRATHREQEGRGTTKGLAWMALSVLSGVASALYDKMIITRMEPLFAQGWANFYISVLLALILTGKSLHDGDRRPRFQWDWTLLLIAVLITGADAAYFFALKQPGAMLSVISVIRRCSVIVTFVCGAIVFREKNLKSKSLHLLLMTGGIAILLMSS
ncbi:MAG: DMT family transporter [Bacteroidales bacterium]|nr:DMT family transporter [Bacteroidales bacterium]